MKNNEDIVYVKQHIKYVLNQELSGTAHRRGKELLQSDSTWTIPAACGCHIFQISFVQYCAIVLIHTHPILPLPSSMHTPDPYFLLYFLLSAVLLVKLSTNDISRDSLPE